MEYHDNIGLEGGAEEQLRLRGKAKDLLTAMGLSLDREEGEEGGQQGGAAAAAGKDAQDGAGAAANGVGKARPPPPPLPESAPPPLPPPVRGERAEVRGVALSWGCPHIVLMVWWSLFDLVVTRLS